MVSENGWSLIGDVCQELSLQLSVGIFDISDETPESFAALVNDLAPILESGSGQPRKLTPENRILLFLIWLKTYS